MADSTLRMKIVTALDNAGIKATKDQIDSLDKQLKNISSNHSKGGGLLDKLFQNTKIGKTIGQVKSLGGSLTKLGGSLTKLATPLAGIAAGFAALAGGIKIGAKLTQVFGSDNIISLDTFKAKLEDLRQTFLTFEGLDKFIAKTFYGRDVDKELKELAQKNREVNSQIADMTQQRIQKQIGLEDKAVKKSIQRLDDKTKAYARQANAMQQIDDARGNAEVLNLLTEKFDKASQLRLAGNDAAADEVEKIYDIKIKTLEADQKIEKQNREIEVHDNKRLKNQEKFLLLYDKMISAENRLKDAQTKLANTPTSDIKTYSKYKKQVDDASAQYEKLFKSTSDAADVMYDDEVASQVMELKRNNLIKQGQLDIKQATMALARTVQQNDEAIAQKQREIAQYVEDYNNQVNDLELSEHDAEVDYQNALQKIEISRERKLKQLEKKHNAGKIDDDEYADKLAEINEDVDFAQYDAEVSFIRSQNSAVQSRRDMDINASRQGYDLYRDYDRMAGTVVSMDTIQNAINTANQHLFSNSEISVHDDALYEKLERLFQFKK